jgi:hypothetical protein
MPCLLVLLVLAIVVASWAVFSCWQDIETETAAETSGCHAKMVVNLKCAQLSGASMCCSNSKPTRMRQIGSTALRERRKRGW